MSPVSPVFHNEATASIGLKKRAQSGNIYSIILDIRISWQSTQLGKKLHHALRKL